jgi:phosphoenolpyruvate-protein kinase (PTS system EI component)
MFPLVTTWSANSTLRARWSIANWSGRQARPAAPAHVEVGVMVEAPALAFGAIP